MDACFAFNRYGKKERFFDPVSIFRGLACQVKAQTPLGR
jgi:hypothetical protein